VTSGPFIGPLSYSDQHNVEPARRPGDIHSAAKAAFAFDARLRLRLRLVVIDSLSSVYNTSDEDNAHGANKIMGQLHALAKAHQCLIVALAHQAKGRRPTDVARGSGAYTAGVSVILTVVATRSATGTVTNRTLNVAKHRNRGEGPLACFEMVGEHLGVDAAGYPRSAGVAHFQAPDEAPTETEAKAKAVK